MKEKVILLVEDHPDYEELTMRALGKNNILNQVVIARDGVQALDYLLTNCSSPASTNPRTSTPVGSTS